jgi:ribosomal protein L7/L12
VKALYWLGYGCSFAVRMYRVGYRKGAEAASNALSDNSRLAQVEALYRADPEKNFIPAIKRHRELFGSSLYDAKTACDAIRERVARE